VTSSAFLPLASLESQQRRIQRERWRSPSSRHLMDRQLQGRGNLSRRTLERMSGLIGAVVGDCIGTENRAGDTRDGKQHSDHKRRGASPGEPDLHDCFGPNVLLAISGIFTSFAERTDEREMRIIVTSGWPSSYSRQGRYQSHQAAWDGRTRNPAPIGNRAPLCAPPGRHPLHLRRSS
jgi:hypothetical protein